MYYIKNVCKWLVLLFGYIVLGTFALIIMYSFPTGRIKEHVAKSSYIFDVEEAYPCLIPGYCSTQLDNFTDSIMLANAMYNGKESVIEKAMANYRMYSDELGIVKSTTHYANDVEADYYSKPYKMYWHGYLVCLKPLLAFFTYGEIRILNGVLQGFLLIYIINLFLNSKLKEYIYAYAIAIIFINPSVTFLSLQYSTVYYIFLCVIIIWLGLLKKGKLTKCNVNLLFFSAGCLTSYLDFLTYPVSIVGVLAILSVQTFGVGKSYLKELFKNIILWGFGYAGMWTGKWFVGSIILKENLFQDALIEIMFRTSIMETEVNRWDAIKENLSVYNEAVYKVIMLIILVYIIVSFCKNRIRVTKNNRSIILIYLMIAMLPFVWMFFASNHSYMHAWFVHRGICVTVLAIGSMYIYIKEHGNISSRNLELSDQDSSVG